MPKFVHTSDWQIGASKKLPGFLKRQMSAINYIYQTAKDRGITTVVVAGDIYDHKKVSLEERYALTELLLRWDRDGISTLLIPGNHDYVRKVGADRAENTESIPTSVHDLDLLTQVDAFRGSVIHAEWNHKTVERDGVYYYMAPLPKSEIKWFQEGMAGLPSIPNDGKPIVVLLHETVSGAVVDNGTVVLGLKDKERLGSDHPTVVNAKLWSDIDLPPVGTPDPDYPDVERVTYWALGDIHKYGRVAEAQYYCGSPCQHKFGEHPPKGFLIVDTDFPDKPEFVEITYENAGVKPLLNVDELPVEAWSEDPPAFYKLKLSEDGKNKPKVLPSSCITVQAPDRGSGSIVTIGSGDQPLAGVEEIIRDKAAGDQALARRTRSLIKQLAARLGVQI